MNPNNMTPNALKVHCIRAAETMTMWAMSWVPALPMLSMDSAGNLGPPATK
jgi:hypothetical protein